MKTNKVSLQETYDIQKIWNEYIRVTKPPNHYNSTQKVDWLDETLEKFFIENGLDSRKNKHRALFYSYEEKKSFLIIVDEKKWFLAKIKHGI
jgi:hypothetical protein